MALNLGGFDGILCCLYHALDLVQIMNHSYTIYLQAGTICFNSNLSDIKSLHEVDAFTKRHRRLITNESCENQVFGMTDFCTVPTYHTNIGYAVFLSLLMLLIFGMNLFFCCSIYRSRVLLRQPSHRFILSLSVSELLIALVVMPIVIDSALHNGFFCSSLPFCFLAYFADHLVVLSSILILLAIGIDRYIAASNPYGYKSLMTNRRATAIIISIWVLSFLFGLNSNFDWSTMTFSGVEINHNQICVTRNPKLTAVVILLCLFIPLIMMGYIYFKILRITLQHTMPVTTLGTLEDVECFQASASCSTDPSEQASTSNAETIISAPERRSRHVTCLSSPKIKAIKVTVFVYGSFVLCWLPGHIITVINLMAPHTIVLDTWLYHILNEVMPLSNAALNVFIYAVMNDDCRRAMQKMLCCDVVQKRIQRKRLEKERLRRAAEKSSSSAIVKSTAV